MSKKKKKLVGDFQIYVQNLEDNIKEIEREIVVSDSH